MEPSVLSAFDPDAGDRAPVDLGILAARLLAARHIVVVVRPGGTVPERLARTEQGRERASVVVSLRAALGSRAEMREIAAPSPAAGLHAALAAERPALAVVGSPRGGAHGRVGLGGTSTRLLDAAPCPVAIAPLCYAVRPLARVAVAVLPSPEGRAALAAASRLASALGTPLRVLMVLNDTPGESAAREVARALAPGAEVATDRHDATGILASAIAAATADVQGRPLQIDARILVGDPVDAIVRSSAEADVLLLGSRAYGPADTVLAGGVARGVLTRAHCPVVLIPREGSTHSVAAFADESGAHA